MFIDDTKQQGGNMGGGQKQDEKKDQGNQNK